MNLLSSFAVFWPPLLFLANVAVATMIVATAGLLFERLARGASLPLRHWLLVSTLAAAVGSPVIIGAMLCSGRTMLQFNLNEPESAIAANATSDFPSESFSASTRPPVEFDQLADAVRSKPAAPIATPANAASRSAAPVGLTLNESWRLSLLPMACVSLALIWLGGSVVAFGRLVNGLIRLRQFSKSLRPLHDEQLRNLGEASARTLHLRTVPQLYESALLLSPLSVGVVRPCVVLPIGAASQFNAMQLRGLLLHEFAHIARRDHFVGVLQRLAAILFWWNVPLHRASTRIAEIREQICDDISTGDGDTHDYAAMLLNVASRVVSSSPLPATIGVFKQTTGEFAQRIHRLLDPRRRIVTNLKGHAKFVAAVCFLMLLAPAVMPLDVRGAVRDERLIPKNPVTATDESAPSPTAAPASADEPPGGVEVKERAELEQGESGRPEGNPIKWPKRLRGVIKDRDGQPIAGATVRLDFEKIHEYTIGRWDETLESDTQVTGSDGEYSFDASDFAKLTHRPFVLMLTVTAEGYEDKKWWCWYTLSDNGLKEHLKDVEMLPGRTVRGRCVDPEGAPVAGAIVKMAASYDSKRPAGAWAWDPRETAADGTFEFSVPREGGAYEVWVVHPEWAPKRVALLQGEDDFGDIHLQEGAPLRGTVRRADGSPVAGTVVVAESVDGGDWDTVSFDATVAAKTDADGKYKLQPLRGAYKVYLSAAEETDNRLEQRFVVADGLPPLVVPARLDLAPGAVQTLDIQSGKTLKVTGAVRWADGRPVPGVEAKASYMPEGNGTGIWIARTLTDENGRYTLELPNPIDDVSINVIGEFDANRVWHTAEPAKSVDAKQKSLQFLGLNALDGDVSGMDWVLLDKDP